MKPRHQVASAWTEHADFAFWLVQALRPRTIVELGVHNGFSYFCFCQAVEAYGLDAKCYGVDTWKGDEHAGFYGEDVHEKVKAINDECYTPFSQLLRMTFDEALPLFADGSVDLLHIDGRHRFEDVSHDFETWRPKMSDQGVVLFHDIAVRQDDFGVWRLWDTLRMQYPSFSFTHGYGLGVLSLG